MGDIVQYKDAGITATYLVTESYIKTTRENGGK